MTENITEIKKAHN